MKAAVDSHQQYHVRLMFGRHEISHFDGFLAQAEEYRDGMKRRFPSLQVTSEPPLPLVAAVSKR